MSGFFTSVEFYVILAVIAAAIVAFAARPGGTGPVQEFLLAGTLSRGSANARPELAIEVRPNGQVRLVRRGVDGITDDGAVSLAVKVKGTDVMIEERLTPGKGILEPDVSAEFLIKFLKPARYHVKYNSQKTGLFAAFPLHVTPGIKTIKELTR